MGFLYIILWFCVVIFFIHTHHPTPFCPPIFFLLRQRGRPSWPAADPFFRRSLLVAMEDIDGCGSVGPVLVECLVWSCHVRVFLLLGILIGVQKIAFTVFLLANGVGSGAMIPESI
jgi:hypothetical protein